MTSDEFNEAMSALLASLPRKEEVMESELIRPWCRVRVVAGQIAFVMNLEAAEMLTSGDGFEGLALSEEGPLIRELEAVLDALDSKGGVA